METSLRGPLSADNNYDRGVATRRKLQLHAMSRNNLFLQNADCCFADSFLAALYVAPFNSTITCRRDFLPGKGKGEKGSNNESVCTLFKALASPALSNNLAISIITI